MDRSVAYSHRGPRRRRSVLGRLALLGSLPLLGASPLGAAPQPPPFPPASDFRSLQLITLACGRENSAEPCEKARTLANPLLDHPRLPASCKDVLWTIRQQAVVAASNSFERREAIDRAARSLTAVCRQQLPVTKPAGDGQPGAQGGLKLIRPSQN
ncbi:MAG: hypothetical protein ER33_07805 [Cyanobium sp. CACIAM 14]|nr:MAG: hypothetical protein ER33_07805 [Cyanobium sp. CACIAM 14]